MATQPQSSSRQINPFWGMPHVYITAPPKSPTLPILPRIHAFIAQNKANSLKTKNNATSCTANTYEQKPLPPHAKKQSQFIAA